MPVPKRKTPKAKQRKRRSHHALTAPALVLDPRSGGWRLNHRPSAADRDRKGRPIELPGA